MSQLLDSLRRVADTRPVRRPPKPAADVILARMGYGRGGGTVRGAVLLLAALVAVAALIGAGFAAARRGPSSGSTPQPPRDLRVAAPQAAALERGKPSPRPADEGTAGPSAEPQARPAATAPRADPDDARVQFGRALALEREGDPARAEAIYRALAAGGALVAPARNNLGLLLHARGDLAGAARELEAAVRYDPGYARANNNLGVVLLAMGRAAEAADHFEAAARLDPRDPGALVNLALAQRDAGLPEVAKESLLRALVLAPDNAAAHYNLAVLFDRAGEPGRAAIHYRAFLEHAGAEHASRAADVRARLDVLEGTR